MIYEYPFNERVRALLRLENIYSRYAFFLQRETMHDHHVALEALFDILEITIRMDLKPDLLKELDRYRKTLDAANPLSATFRNQIEEVTKALIEIPGRIGNTLKQNEWLMGVKNRTFIPGGGCSFDNPSYWTWLQKPAVHRLTDLHIWFASLQPLIDAVNLILKLMRKDAEAKEIQVQAGHYKHMLQDRKTQLLRIEIDGDIVPEISANRFMLWIRFTRADGTAKPKPIQRDITCKLTLC